MADKLSVFAGQFAGQIDNGLANGKNWGVCDPEFLGIRQAIEPWRHSRALVLFNVVDPQTISLARGTTLDLFSKGTGEAGPSQGYADGLTLAETDANRGGALAKRGWKYKVRALGFTVGPARVPQFTQGTPPLENFLDPSWLDEFESRMQIALLWDMACRIQFEDEACNLDGGPLFLFPQHAALTSGGSGRPLGLITNGVSMGPATITALRAVYETGDRDADDKTVINITMERGITIFRANAEIPEGVTQVGVEVDCLVYGDPVCRVPCAPALCPPQGGVNVSMTPAQYAAAKAAGIVA